MKTPTIGTKAPEFTLADQNGLTHTLKDYRGQWVVLYFYPKDDTPGCTTEACGLRDEFPAFEKLKVPVLGVSVDSVKSHKKFSDKYALPFLLLADEDKVVVNLYGVWNEKKFMGRTYMGTLRTTFLIDPKGYIRKVYEKVKPADHASQLLIDLGQLLS